MTSLRIKEKISKLVESQLPEFISSDYTVFVEFLEAYYRFLEQDENALELVQNARKYSDIDSTAESFIQYFLTNYAKDIPNSVLVNKKLLIKRIRDLYESKGSSLSFTILFQLLYGETVNVTRPYDLVLRASDGVWEQPLSIQVELVSGSGNNLVGKLLKVNKNGLTYTDQILKVKFLYNNVYEIFIPFTSTVNYNIEDIVYVGISPNYDLLATVIPVTSSLEILRAGYGFKPGEVYNIVQNNGSGTLIKVLKTHANTGVASFKTINYGYGYASNTSFTFEISTYSGISAYNKNFTTTTGGFKDQIVVAQPHSNTTSTRYFESDYVPAFDLNGLDYVQDYYSYFEDIYVQNDRVTLGYTFTPLSSSSTTDIQTSETTSSDNLAALLKFNMGALARYPGEYKSSQGFISEPDVRISDDNQYQPFSYQIQSNLDISKFYSIVKKLIHPAGTNLFANRTLNNTANIRSRVQVLTRSNVLIQLNDSFSTRDVLSFTTLVSANSFITVSDLSITKLSTKLSDEIITLTDDNTYNFNKVLEDSVNNLEDDLTKIDVNKLLSNSISTSESTNYTLYSLLEDSQNTVDSTDYVLNTFPFDDSIIIEDNLLKFYDPTVTDSSVLGSDSLTLTTYSVINDVVTLSNVASSVSVTSINNNYSRASTSDSGLVSSLAYVIDYFDYFVDIYVSDDVFF